LIDTSVMVAGLVRNHEFHAVARPHVVESARGQVPGLVVAEAWAALRRAPWNLDAATVAETLGPWSSEGRVAATAASAYAEVLRTGRSLNLGGNVHDLLIAMTCRDHGLALATLDRRQATLASGLTDLETILLLPEG
jgi:predicted nucleic acid-binding protein